MSSRKPGLTKRVLRVYHSILQGRGGNDDDWYYGRFYGKYSSARLNARSAYFFAKKWRSRDIDLKALQKMVIDGGEPEMAYLWARDIPGASIKRLQAVVLEFGDVEQLRRFQTIPGANIELLEKMAVIQEVMDL